MFDLELNFEDSIDFILAMRAFVELERIKSKETRG